MAVTREVVYELKVIGGDAAAREVRKPATAARGAAKDFDAEREARNQQIGAFRKREVYEARRARDPRFAREESQREEREEREAEAKQQQRAQSAASAARSRLMQRVAVAGFASNVIGGAMGGAATALGGIDATQPVSKAFKDLYVEISEGIPIFGQLFKGARELGQALTGLGQQMKNAAEFSQTVRRQAGLTEAQIEGRSAMRQELGGVTRGVEAARGSAAVAAARAAAIRANPALLEGEAGAAALGIVGARAEAGVATGAIGRRRAEEAPLAKAAAEASANVAAQRATVQEAMTSQRMGREAGLGAGRQGILDKEAADAQAQLATKLKAEQAALNELKAAQLRTQESINTAGEKSLTISKAEADAAKGKLAALKEEEAKTKGGLAQFQKAGPLEQARMIQDLRQFKEGGIAGMRPEQLARLEGIPAVAGKIEEARAKQAEATPEGREFLALTGQRALGEIRKDIKVQQQIIMKVELDEAATRAAITDAVNDAGAKLKELIIKQQENREATAAAEAQAGIPAEPK